MGFRFQKRIKVAPGITLNLSKSGVSTSIGSRGARVTLGHGKTRTTVGIPGTGISHTSVSSHTTEQPGQKEAGVPIVGAMLAVGIFFIFLIVIFA